MALRIKTIAKLTGIREATLRAWERRYGFPVPQRQTNNYRTYSREDAEAIRRVARLLEHGYTASEAIHAVRSTPTDSLPLRQQLEERFWSAVMVLDGEAVDEVLQRAHDTMEPLVLCDEFLLPLLRKMGARLDVAREHLASAAIRQRLRTMIAAIDEKSSGPGIVLACPPDDHHEGGLLGLALHLRCAGWRVIILGANTPIDAIQSAVINGRASMVAVSFVREYSAEEYERLVRSLLASLSVPVVVGGPAARDHLRLTMSTGAWFADSASDVLALFPRFTAVPIGQG